MTRLYKLLRSDSISSETKAWLFAAVTKLTPQAHSSPIVENLIQEFTVSLNTCLRQHAFELKHLHENEELMKSLLQSAQNCDDIVVRMCHFVKILLPKQQFLHVQCTSNIHQPVVSVARVMSCVVSSCW